MSLSPEALSWRRSTRCANASCVEVAARDDHVWVRDSARTVLRFERDVWLAFVAGLKSRPEPSHQ